jgi:hypothetical protein
MQRTLGNWHAEVRTTVDPNRLQDIARSEGFSRILLITPGSTDYLSESLLRQEQKRPFATLPDIRPFRETLSRSLQAVSVFENVTGTRVLSDATKNVLKLSGALTEDLMTPGQPLTSQTLEELGKIGLDLLQKRAGLFALDGIGDMVGSLSSQIGRAAKMPNLDEATKFLDGFNKSVWAMTGYVLGGGNPGAAQTSSKVGDLAAHVMRGRTASMFEQDAMTFIHGDVINQYLDHLDRARASGTPAFTFTEMYQPDLARQMKLPDWKVSELNNLAWWHNQTITKRTAKEIRPSAADYVRTPIPTRREEIERKPDIIVYDGPEKWGGPPPRRPPPPPPPIASNDYRLPSTPSDKRGGVKMKADVVKGEPADTSEMFGGGTSEKPMVVNQQEGLYSPFLLFCAVPVTGK